MNEVTSEDSTFPLAVALLRHGHTQDKAREELNPLLLLINQKRIQQASVEDLCSAPDLLPQTSCKQSKEAFSEGMLPFLLIPCCPVLPPNQHQHNHPHAACVEEAPKCVSAQR